MDFPLLMSAFDLTTSRFYTIDIETYRIDPLNVSATSSADDASRRETSPRKGTHLTDDPGSK